MSNKNQYWKGLEELEKRPDFVAASKNEFAEGLPLEEALSGVGEFNTNRRDFLKYFGFSISAVALAACNKAPVKYAIPYVEKPSNVTPGLPLYYASTCGACNVGCGVLVKVREGRPIKLEGNEDSPISKGGLCGTGQASILSLYDTNRLAHPVDKDGIEIEDWSKVDADVIKALDAAQAAGKEIAIVVDKANSPSLNKALEVFKAKYPAAAVYQYQPVSYSGILNANDASFGKKVVPSYHFEKAEVIVSFGADFLGTWISPVEFSKDYVKNRVPKSGKMSQHFQFESILSLSGANADYRFPMKESKEGIYLVTLYNKLAQKAGVSQMPMARQEELAGNAIAQVAEALWKAKGKSLVVSKSNIKENQMVVNAINHLLENYGQTIDVDNYSMQHTYSEEGFDRFVADASANKVGAALFVGTNPVYSYPETTKLMAALKKVGMVVSTAGTRDETAELANYVCPSNHYLESWADAEVKKGLFQLTQPTISPVFNTRQEIESLLVWAGMENKAEDGYSLSYQFIKNNWKESITPAWDKALERGVYNKGEVASSVPALGVIASEIVAGVEKNVKNADKELILYLKGGPKDGAMGTNPWVHEMPDPISKVTWDNYVSMSKTEAASIGVEDGDTVNITTGAYTLENMPVLIQPGQATGTLAIAVGYGRKLPETVKNDLKDLGKNAYPFAVRDANGALNFNVTSGVKVEKASASYELARTQTHHSIEGRDMVREATLSEYNENPYVRNEHKHNLISLWEDYDYSKGHHWAMAIDLNACTGCGACVVSCSIENNVPVVGRDEIRRRREMHWIRIDRYYSFASDRELDATVKVGPFDVEETFQEGAYVTKETEIDAIEKAKNGEDFKHYDNVKVVFQPVMCQHCDNAPCETVCPVLATTHSKEGLNQMTYNRCIGTKYCGNNCPYKVRRFNWFRYNDNDMFDYHFNNDLGKMVINPDVTVRTRGVMEKCSFCIQNIQSAKLAAKREGRKMSDGDVQTACARSCPSNAIVFGDLNDQSSEISKLYKNERSYHMLEELDVRPSVVYMTKIRNKKEIEKSGAHHS
jgi:molybdopterin-containing oxidoreductase family iron-sulfur binding subunit